MTTAFGIDIPAPLVLVGPALVILFAVLGWMLGQLVVHLASRGVRKTQTELDDVILKAIRAPLCAAGGLVGAWFILRGLPLPKELDLYLNRGWIVFSTILLVSIGLRTINGLSKDVLAKSPTLGGSASMIRVVGRIIVLSMGGVMILQSLGIAVEPLIASLGIGSLAIGLALKDTLSHFFAGVYLFADRPIRVGDYIRLESGQEGFVHQISWRATRILMPANNMIVVPNSKLADAILVNFDLPDPPMSLSLPISVSYSCDPARVMAVLEEEAAGAVGTVPGLVGDPAPILRFSGFGDNSLDFTLIVRVASFMDQFAVQSDLRRRIFDRFTREGIEIPFPQRTVHIPELSKMADLRGAQADRPDSEP